VKFQTYVTGCLWITALNTAQCNQKSVLNQTPRSNRVSDRRKRYAYVGWSADESCLRWRLCSSTLITIRTSELPVRTTTYKAHGHCVDEMLKDIRRVSQQATATRIAVSCVRVQGLTADRGCWKVCAQWVPRMLRNWNNSRWTLVDNRCVGNMKATYSCAILSPQKAPRAWEQETLNSLTSRRFASTKEVQDHRFCWKSDARWFLRHLLVMHCCIV
jgi:hypothetical protein